MSTYPYYLAAIDPDKSFDENICNLLFNQYGAFFTLPDQLLSNFTKIQDVYNAILTAIAHRREYYLFSKSGFDFKIKENTESDIHLFELNDLFREQGLQERYI